MLPCLPAHTGCGRVPGGEATVGTGARVGDGVSVREGPWGGSGQADRRLSRRGNIPEPAPSRCLCSLGLELWSPLGVSRPGQALRCNGGWVPPSAGPFWAWAHVDGSVGVSLSHSDAHLQARGAAPAVPDSSERHPPPVKLVSKLDPSTEKPGTSLFPGLRGRWESGQKRGRGGRERRNVSGWQGQEFSG